MTYQEKIEIRRKLIANPRLDGGEWRNLSKRFGDLYYVSYGRYGIVMSFEAAGVRRGELILVPAFLCEDVVYELIAAGFKVEFYHLDVHLNPDLSSFSEKVAKGVLAVNYFGFPMELDGLREYCAHHDSVLVEDSSHGFLSTDAFGQQLGARGDLGVLNFRKLFPFRNGAAITVNNQGILSRELGGFKEIDYGPLVTCRKGVKEALRLVLPYVGNPVKVQRAYSSLKKRFSHNDAELLEGDFGNHPYSFDLPHQPEKPLCEKLGRINFAQEIKRRNELYDFFQERLKEVGGRPVFDRLPNYVVPYTFPFRCDDGAEGHVREFLGSYGIVMQGWPDFHPEAPRIREQYEGVKFIDFVW